jgi:hypothetical protein
MSLTNPIDYTGFSSPFNVDLAVNARNKADAFTKSQAALRAGALGGSAASFLGKAKGQQFMDEAGAYAEAQQRGANMFSGIAGAVGMVGGMGAQGMFDPSKTFHNNSLFGQTKFGAGGGTLPDAFGNKVGTLGPNYGIPQ